MGAAAPDPGHPIFNHAEDAAMNDYIRRAEHALRTGQPNLAMLYMRRGLTEASRRDFLEALRRVGHPDVMESRP
jgi:hypothetical protein